LDALGRKKEADEAFASVLRPLEILVVLEPQNSVLHNDIGWLCAAVRRNLDVALQHAIKAVELKPGDASVLDTCAEVEFQRGAQRKAIELMERAIQLSSADYYKRQLQRMKAGDTTVPIP
jgi:Flp pilus assembly protein TadD